MGTINNILLDIGCGMNTIFLSDIFEFNPSFWIIKEDEQRVKFGYDLAFIIKYVASPYYDKYLLNALNPKI